MGYFKIPLDRPFPDPDLQEVRLYRADSPEVALCRHFVREKRKGVRGFEYPGKGLQDRGEALVAIHPWAEVFHRLLKDYSEKEIIAHMSHLAVNTPADLRNLLALDAPAPRPESDPEATEQSRHAFFEKMRQLSKKYAVLAAKGE